MISDDLKNKYLNLINETINKMSEEEPLDRHSVIYRMESIFEEFVNEINNIKEIKNEIGK